MEHARQLLIAQESRIGHSVAHLHEVLERQLGNGLRIRDATRLVPVGPPPEARHQILIITLLQAVRLELLEALGQDRTVLEARVHALPVKRHDRVRGVAEQQYPLFVVPRVAAHRHQTAHRVVAPVALEVREVLEAIGKLPLEEVARRSYLRDFVEAVGARVRRKERTREAAVGVGQRDHHEGAPGPDVQRRRVEPVRAVGCGRDVQLFVAVVEVGLRVVEARRAQHRTPDRRERPVGPEHHRRAVLLYPFRFRKTYRQTPLVEAAALRVEAQLDAPGRLGRVEQQEVQLAATHRVDRLPGFAVRLTRQRPIARVHEAPAHRQGVLADLVGQAGQLQGVPAARAHGEVDAAPALKTRRAHVGSAVYECHVVALLSEERRQQRAYQPGANDEGVVELRHSRAVRCAQRSNPRPHSVHGRAHEEHIRIERGGKSVRPASPPHHSSPPGHSRARGACSLVPRAAPPKFPVCPLCYVTPSSSPSARGHRPCSLKPLTPKWPSGPSRATSSTSTRTAYPRCGLSCPAW